MESIRKKVYSISHDDLHPFIRSRSDKQIAEDMYKGRDLYHRSGIADAETWSSDDSRLPPYFLENKERFKMFTNQYFYENNKHLLE